MKIVLPDGIEIEKVYGYSPIIEGNKMRFTLKNMNAGLTQIFLFKMKEKQAQSEAIAINVTYFDTQKGEKEVENMSVFFPTERKPKNTGKRNRKEHYHRTNGGSLARNGDFIYKKRHKSCSKLCS